MFHAHDDHDSDDGGATRLGDDRPLIVEFGVPMDAFLLRGALDAAPEVTVEFEQLAPTRPDPLPYLWTAGGDREAFEAAAADDGTVDRLERVTTFDEGALYRTEWTDPDDGLLGWLRGNEAALIESESIDGEWLLKLRVDSREMLGDLRAHCDRNGVRFRLVRLFSLSNPKTGQFDVSRKQREVLVVSLEMGYYEIPREATLGDVADALDISTNSASERLRRAQTNLLNNTVTVGNPTGIGIEESDESIDPSRVE